MSIKNPFSSMEKSIKHGIDDLGNDVKHGINQLGDETKRGVSDLGHQAESQLKGAEQAALRDVENAGGKAIKDLQHAADHLADGAEELVSEALSSLAKAVEAETLQKAHDLVKASNDELTKLASEDPDLVDAINAMTFGVKLGPMTLRYSNFYERSAELTDALDRIASHPPAFRRTEFIEMVNVLGPTTVDLGLSVEFALVIGSSELGVGVFMEEIQLKLFTRLGDRALKALGVPE